VVGVVGLVGSLQQGGGQLPQPRWVTLQMGVAVATDLEADGGPQGASVGAPVVVAVVDGTSRDDDPQADGGIRSRGIMGAHS
jgi:hypothetical protein